MTVEKEDYLNKLELKDQQFAEMVKDKEQLMKMLNAAEGNKAEML